MSLAVSILESINEGENADEVVDQYYQTYLAFANPSGKDRLSASEKKEILDGMAEHWASTTPAIRKKVAAAILNEIYNEGNEAGANNYAHRAKSTLVGVTSYGDDKDPSFEDMRNDVFLATDWKKSGRRN